MISYTPSIYPRYIPVKPFEGNFTNWLIFDKMPMMTEIDFKIVGLKVLAKDIDALGKNFARSTLRTALRAATKPVVKRAKDKAPVRTGNLRRSIRGEASVKRDGRGEARVGFLPSGFYGTFIELGTSTQPARPMLRPALDEAEAQGEIQQAFIVAINRTIEKRLARVRR